MTAMPRARVAAVLFAAAAAAAIGGPGALVAQDERSARADRLSSSQSPYLRRAASGKIAWFQWGTEPFELARAVDRPILVSVGASWCHFCREMDERTFGDDGVAAIVGQSFVAVKVDRDERPDVDRALQDAVNVLSGEGGWPLTLVLTPDGRPFFGGNFFPPGDENGRPGLRGVLERVLAVHGDDRNALLGGADELSARLSVWNETLARRGPLSKALLDGIAAEILRQHDDVHGGFGKDEGPKYPLMAPVELAIALGFERNDPKLLAVATGTLEKMAASALRDALAGGFHRSTADRAGRLPRFEKTLPDNAAILRAAVHAFGATGGGERFRDTAAGIVADLEETLCDRERGGFFASVAASAPGEAAGAYTTWTRAEIDAVLVPASEDARLFAAIHGIAQRTPGAPDERFALARAATTSEVAKRFGLSEEHVAAAEKRAAEKLRAKRRERNAPPVDRTIYLGWNGLAALAFLEAAPVLLRDDLAAFALASIDRCLREGRGEGGSLLHAIPAEGGAKTPGFLDDHLLLSLALLAAHEATGDPARLLEARRLADVAIARFLDPETGAFFDTDGSGLPGPLPRHAAFGDSPHPGGTSLAALLLSKLAAATGDDSYAARARKALESFAGSVPLYGHSAGTYGLALLETISPAPHVVVVGDPLSKETDALRRAALATYRPGRLVTIHAPDAKPPRPPAEEGRPVAYVCLGERCAPPASDPEALRLTLAEFGRDPKKPAR